MLIKSVTSLKWVRADHQAFDAQIDTDEFGPIPYTSTPDSPSDYGQEIWTKGIAGDYGPIAEFIPLIITPIGCPLSPDQFYSLMDNLGKLDQFMAEIETVTPTAKKLTCRNQFNNSTSFTWDMVLMTLVAPKIWGETWQDDISAAWIAATS